MGRADMRDEGPREAPSSGVRGPAHPRPGSGGRHRRRSDAASAAAARLAGEVPIHPRGADEEEGLVTDLLDDEERAVAPAAGRRRRRRNPVLLFLRDVAVVVVLAVVISMLVKTFLVRPYYIPSASMEQTLVTDDRVLVNLLVPELVPLNRGDVVVFTDPGGWLEQAPPPTKTPGQAIIDGTLEAVGLKPEETNNSLIKRIIGLPGDHVVCCNSYGQVTVNDQAISEPYVELQGNREASGTAFDVVVPDDAIWVMGDNRYNSEDSRYHQDLPTGGFVPIDDVVGRAVVLNWPFDRFTILGNYPEVFANVPSRDPETQG